MLYQGLYGANLHNFLEFHAGCMKKVQGIIKLRDKGYQAYYGEYNFMFTGMEDKSICVTLRDCDDEDMKVYRHLDEYFEEVV